jgi:hypothetical protein
MTAQLFDSNNVEQIVARWFVNYDSAHDPTRSTGAIGGDIAIPAPGSTTVFTRTLPEPPFPGGSAFRPFLWEPPSGTGTRVTAPFNEPGTIRVVELLVSNGFRSGPNTATNREPAPNFEVQLHRWVFLLVPGTENCGAHPIP